MEIRVTSIFWVYFIVTWFANINDLIRGNWFYSTTQSILFWNFFGIMAFIGIIIEYRERIKFAKGKKGELK